MSYPPYNNPGGEMPGTYVPPPVDNTPFVPGAAPGVMGPGGAYPGQPGMGGYPGQPGGYGAVPPGGYPAGAGMPGAAYPPGAPMGGMPGAYPPGGVAPGMAPGMGAPYGAGVPGMHPGAAAPGYHPGAPAAGMMNSVGGGRRVYHITVAAMGLKARDSTLFGKTDPYCVLFVQQRPGVWTRLGRTETCRNNPNPMWTHQFVVEHPGHANVQLKFEVYDEDRGRDNLMETVEVSLEVILNHPSGRYEAHLGRHGFSGQSGVLTISAQRAGVGIGQHAMY